MSARPLVIMIAAALAGSAGAQRVTGPIDGLGSAAYVIVPQARSFALVPRATGIEIESVDAHVEILERVARTTIQMALRNHSASPDDAIVLLPVPPGSAVSAFAFQGESAEPQVQVLPAEEARRLYDAIVARVRDPALLEFAGYNLIRTSVFPIPAQGSRTVRLTYEQVLAADGDRVDYVLPRSESLERRRPWTIAANVRSTRPISAVYSPSHQLFSQRLGAGQFAVKLAEESRGEPGPFRLSWLLEGEGVSASLMAYPDPTVGGGYFLLLAGLPAELHAPTFLKREVTLVIDRSGSMAGAKWAQARAAARKVLDGLAAGEAFNIIDYGTTVTLYSPRPIIKDDRTWADACRHLETIAPSGGTNINDALLEALRQPPAGPEFLPIVLFLTDGLPTIGRTAEPDIRAMVERGNPQHRRVFTFGVGYDVNAPLLDAIAAATRGTSTYVLPRDDIGPAVAGVFRRLAGPVLADPVLETLASDGSLATRLVGELIPAALPDLYEGDQLVLLGQYHSEGPITFRIRGTYLGTAREFTFAFELDKATTRQAFVSRLWASRRIAELVDQIRQEGAVPGASDPRDELVDEIVRLSTRFGVLTEYTAFLATEGTDLTDPRAVAEACSNEVRNRVIVPRSGAGAVHRAVNVNAQKAQTFLNYENRYIDESAQPIEFVSVQQVADLAFFRRGERWIDSRLLTRPPGLAPDEVVSAGSDLYRALMARLTAEGRQAVFSLDGDILLQLDGRAVLIKAPGC